MLARFCLCWLVSPPKSGPGVPLGGHMYQVLFAFDCSLRLRRLPSPLKVPSSSPHLQTLHTRCSNTFVCRLDVSRMADRRGFTIHSPHCAKAPSSRDANPLILFSPSTLSLFLPLSFSPSPLLVPFRASFSHTILVSLSVDDCLKLRPCPSARSRQFAKSTISSLACCARKKKGLKTLLP